MLSSIPDDVLVQILALIQESHPRSLYNLLFVKSTKHVAEALLYQRVTIICPDHQPWDIGSHWPAHKRLLERLSNSQDHMRSLVRELTILDWKGPATPDFGVEKLERLVENIQELVAFKWESWPHIPTTVLSTILTRFPTVQLYVKNIDRGRSSDGRYGRDTTLDLDLLHSPQLHSLELVVLQTGDYYCGPSQINSEFPVLRQLFHGNPNLRILRLGGFQEVCYSFYHFAKSYESFDTSGDGPLNLQFQKKDQFPTLVELVILKKKYCIHDPGYDFSKEHCIAWKKVMDWKALQKLDLGNARPDDFFMIFCGHIPQLKSLKFRLNLGKDSSEDPVPLLRLTTRFLDSITGLEELEVADWTRAFFPDLCASIMSHGKSLNRLEINASERGNRNFPGWSAESLSQMLSELPKLRTLSIAVDILRAPNRGWVGSLIWPTKPFSLLCGYPNIESLKIRIRLPEIRTVQAKIAHENISTLATDLFQDFFRRDARSRLEIVEVQAQRIVDVFFESGIQGVTAKVGKSVSDDAPEPLDRGYTVEVDDTYDEF
ncbi:hypothetical protein DL98DRAFT_608610 [Cadophora sp. DSE1049]|nr:hypothetical protein DL98DRAFT_608610 [Cadophora sp. DSE1049]